MVCFDFSKAPKKMKPPKPIQETLGIIPLNNALIPPVLYTGNLNDKLIEDVRTGVYTPEFHRLTDNKFPLFEGMVCKGTLNRGDFCGKMWSAKTNEYFSALRNRWGEEGIKKYGE